MYTVIKIKIEDAMSIEVRERLNKTKSNMIQNESKGEVVQRFTYSRMYEK